MKLETGNLELKIGRGGYSLARSDFVLLCNTIRHFLVFLTSISCGHIHKLFCVSR